MRSSSTVRTIGPTQGRLQLLDWLRRKDKNYFWDDKVIVYSYANENLFLFQSDLIIEFGEGKLLKIIARIRKPNISWYQNIWVYLVNEISLANLIDLVTKSKHRNGHIAIKESLLSLESTVFDTILEAAHSIQFCLLERLEAEIQVGVHRPVEKKIRYNSLLDPNQSRLEFQSDGSVVFVCPWESS